MLQRVQSLYMLLVALLMAGMMFMPLAVMEAGGVLYVFNVFGVESVAPAMPERVYSAWPLFAVALVVAGLSLGNIFLFRKRLLQIRLCIYNALLIVGFYVYFGVVVYMLQRQAADLSMGMKFGLSFPLVSLILDYLAFRGISADIALLRSIDRLR